MKICKVKNCNGRMKAKGYCNKHYLQLRLYGKILKRTTHSLNLFVNCGDYYEMCVYNNKCKEIGRVKIDTGYLEKVKSYKWCLFKNYVYDNKNKVHLHRLIIGHKKGYEIDHINHDTLDNREQNLRHCTTSQNQMNQKAKGYYYDKTKKAWRVYITINKKLSRLGYFKNEQDAINVRRKAESKYYGEFAYRY